MAGWLILAGLAIAVIGVIAKVLYGVLGDLRSDRARYGGRITRDTAYKSLAIIAVILILVVVFIVWPLVTGGSGEGIDR
ncbi:MAG: hypothetical protein AB7V42_00500 [Thermoleophilia bacterium]